MSDRESSGSHRARKRLAYLVVAVPALEPSSDASLASAVELAFPSLIDPGARNA